ncbi:MAG: 50S ribosomal protein L25/general stress protein Ctc [Prevotella sp.]|uniref:50S ribosomal protein L25/general stress protein Ctc n=1 Tax=Prevotella sp. TaxID=59823 RepID=UPI002A30DCD3|nr:50S ribosomal protein L25/general stress protein Ctc [Prevotella sp.]MDD7317491.1 50S ribosomal protein L25/general stress protein Ctc [Prevotellaceae bacterium]MDY4019173.1 50S ribosomal protein L25/general stress protein Ctc [Prevotella sp.]
MKEISVTGQKRSDLGKKATKMLRKEGLVPCNIYGEKKGENGLPEALAFAVPMSELRKLVYTPNIYVVNILIDGEKHLAIMKELQFHPVTDALLHVDFFAINDEKPVVIGVPVKLNGLAQGVRDGGRMSLIVRKVNVRAKYKDIPETLDIDVTNMTIGKSIKVGDLHFDGLEMVTSKEVVVCTIKATRKSNAAAQAGANGDAAE